MFRCALLCRLSYTRRRVHTTHRVDSQLNVHAPHLPGDVRGERDVLVTDELEAHLRATPFPPPQLPQPPFLFDER